MGLATRLGMMGALVGGMNAIQRQWETERAEEAERRKQERLEQIQMEREQRAETRTIAAEGRADTRTIASEDRQETRTIASEGREDVRWGTRFEKEDVARRQAARESDSRQFSNQRALQEDSQAHDSAESAKERASRETIADNRIKNNTTKPIRLMVEDPSGIQSLVNLQPGQSLPPGSRIITTNNAGSPMPSGTKDKPAARATTGATKPAWAPPQGVTVRQVK